VSADGKNIPVFVSPEFVIDGKLTVPSVKATCSELLIVIAVLVALSSIPVDVKACYNT
jgi:hypothetical protein